VPPLADRLGASAPELKVRRNYPYAGKSTASPPTCGAVFRPRFTSASSWKSTRSTLLMAGATGAHSGAG